MIHIEIWASGGGTNADVLMQYFKSHPLIQIKSVGCNRKLAGVFKVADKHKVSAYYWENTQWNSENILSKLKERQIDYVILAGFLKLVHAEVTKAYDGKMVNIHPSLLPLYGGINMYGEHVHNAVLDNKETSTGITIHEVNEEFDKGKILAQFTTSLDPNTETLESIKAKIQKLEHANFAPIVEAWIQSKTN